MNKSSQKYLFEVLNVECKVIPVVELNDLPHVDVLYVYGVCRGVKNAIFLEDDPGLIASAVRSDIDVEWLREGTIENLAERYPVERIEVIASPGRTLPRNLRLQLMRKTALTHSHVSDRLQSHHLFDNFVENLPHLSRAFYANRLQFPGIPAIICGAGPSLETSLLKKLEGRALIIAGGSAIAALHRAGIQPHFGLAIDPNVEEHERLKNNIRCPLLFSTRVHPGVLRENSGPIGYMRAGIGGAPELFLDEELALTDPLLGEGLSNEALSVTSMCLSFAKHIGSPTIILNGVDLAYTGGKHYAAGVVENNQVGSDVWRRKDKRGKKVQTALRWVMEAAALGQYAKKNKGIRWINTTAGGLKIPGMEEMSLESISLPEQGDLRGRIEEQIAKHPMPKLQKDLAKELKRSIGRVIEHLEVLAGEKIGPKVLAEEDLKEELAHSILFYDSEHILREHKNKWQLFLEMARRFN